MKSPGAVRINNDALPPAVEMAALEDDVQILSYVCPYTQFPLWLMVRGLYYFTRGTMTRPVPAISTSRTGVDPKTLLRAALWGMRERVKKLRRAEKRKLPVVFLPMGDVKMPSSPQDAPSFIAALASEISGSSCIWLNSDEIPMRQLLVPRPYSYKLYSSSLLNRRSLIDILAEREVRFRLEMAALGEHMAGRLSSRLGVSFDLRSWRRLTEHTLENQRRFEGRVSHWMEILGQAGPQLLILRDGPYQHRRHIVVAARKLGIRTADLQHGKIDPGHFIYNVGPGLKDSEALRCVVPDFFLSYGDHWNEGTNLPWRSFSMGHPERAVRINQAKEVKCKGPKKLVTVIGQLPNKKFLDIAERLSRRLPNDAFELIYRPHPSQRGATLKRVESGINLVVDLDKPLFEILAMTDILVGESSTVLVEAVGIVPLIFRLESEGSALRMAEFNFPTFASPEELANRLSASEGLIGADREMSIDPERLWSAGWRQNFKKFISYFNIIDS